MLACAAVEMLIIPSAKSGNVAGKLFPSPQAAITELGAATAVPDTNALKQIFGPGIAALENADRVQATNDLSTFHEALLETNHLVRVADNRMVLEIGDDMWPFPIPIVRQANGWQFDTAAGVQEILNRRVGRNELDVLSAMRAYVDAQREYASEDRDGDGVLEYAQRISSSPGQTDGLYWPEELNGIASPLGPLVASAQTEGYFAKKANPEQGPQPFHGYYFKVLTRQGKHAPGGKYDYVINGNMIGGFAMAAWPAEYGASGVMTFIVNQQGRVYQKNLGTKTDAIVKGMKDYDPDPSWKLSRE
jgi:hypothetical protein